MSFSFICALLCGIAHSFLCRFGLAVSPPLFSTLLSLFFFDISASVHLLLIFAFSSCSFCPWFLFPPLFISALLPTNILCVSALPDQIRVTLCCGANVNTRSDIIGINKLFPKIPALPFSNQLAYVKMLFLYHARVCGYVCERGRQPAFKQTTTTSIARIRLQGHDSAVHF